MSPKRRRLRIAIACVCGVATPGQALAVDVTSSMVNLGNAPALAGANRKAILLKHILHYNGRLYFAGSASKSQTIVYYDLSSQTFKTEKTAAGTQFSAYAESVTNLQNTNYDLLIAGEDGSPNDKTGLHINDIRNDWRFRTTPYDNVHGHTQYRFKNLFFATVAHNPDFGGGPSKGPGIVYSDDNLGSWHIVGDAANDFSTIAERTSTTLFELKGHLFSSGYYRPPAGWSITGWLTHYTDDATHSFEIAHNRSVDFHSSLTDPYGGYYTIADAMELGGNKGVLLSGSSAIRFKFTPTVGRNGTYPRPDGETVISTKAKDLCKKNGIGYILENSGTTTTVRWSSDLITWKTLFTCETGSATVTAMEIVGGDVYFLGTVNLYRVPGAAFGGLPSGYNIAPVAVADSYATQPGVPLYLAAGSQGILVNDTDGNEDKLSATLASGPSHGTLVLERNGRFTYTPASGFSGNDVFTYTASDGVASMIGSVTIAVYDVRYSTWSSGIQWGQIPLSERSPLGDPDGDGSANYWEMVFGQNPLSPDPARYPSGQSVANGDGSVTLSLHYPKADPTAVCMMEHSGALEAGNWSSDGVAPETFDSGSGLYFQSYTFSASSPRGFTRLKGPPSGQ